MELYKEIDGNELYYIRSRGVDAVVHLYTDDGPGDWLLYAHWDVLNQVFTKYNKELV